MKSIIIAIILLISFPSIAQTICEVQYISLEKNNDASVIKYTDFNQRRATIKNFVVDDVDKFYMTIMQGFKKMPEESLQITFKNDLVTLNYQKKLGVISLRMYHTPINDQEIIGMTRFLTKFQILDLFGKKED